MQKEYQIMPAKKEEFSLIVNKLDRFFGFELGYFENLVLTLYKKGINTYKDHLVVKDNDEIIGIGSVEGFVGPVGLNVKVLVDSEVAMMKNIVVGANQKDAHLINVNFGRDFTGEVLQIRATVEGDICPICGKKAKHVVLFAKAY